MSKVIKFESSEQRRRAIEETACAWLARLEAGANDEDKQALSAWLYESKEHVEIFFEVSAAWDQLSVLLELSEVFPLERYKFPSESKKSGFWTGMVVIASLVVILTIAVSMLRYGPTESQATEGLVDVTTYATDVGQRSTVTLPDSSEIVLNTNTLLEVRYSAHERRIFLKKGEALFSVAKDSRRPFRVVVGNHVVQAIGTEFAVQSIDDSVEVMVKEGVVGFGNLGNGWSDDRQEGLPGDIGLKDSISLVAGEVITSEGQDDEAVERLNLPLEEIESRLSWQYGILSFLGDPLDQVIREVNRYTTTVIETDEDVRDIRVDGSFRVGDIDALLLAMEQNFGIQVILEGDGKVHLSKVNAN